MAPAVLWCFWRKTEEIRYHLTNTKQYKFHQVLYLHRYQIFPPVTMFTWKFHHFANGSLYHLINWWKCPQFLVKAKQFPHWSCFDINLHINTTFIVMETESKVSCTMWNIQWSIQAGAELCQFGLWISQNLSLKCSV